VRQAYFSGPGDFHEPAHTDTQVIIPFGNNQNPRTAHIPNHCTYTISLYATDGFAREYTTKTPIIATCTLAGMFAFMILLFALYDVFVFQRNEKVVIAAIRSTAIVSSMFPASVRDRVFAKEAKASSQDAGRKGDDYISTKDAPPIAEFFPECTILYADIAGFTQWSANREPADGT
jgi:hypothetical protein